MKIKNVIEFVYWEVIPILIGFTLIQFFKTKTIIDLINNIVFCIILSFPIIYIHISIGKRIFSKDTDLVKKIINCDLRKQHGYDYCTRCHDSYTCANKLN